jgi:hypothetical protein
MDAHAGSSLVFHANAVMFMTTRIAFMAYLSSLTGIRRLAFEHSIRTTQGELAKRTGADAHLASRYAAAFFPR